VALPSPFSQALAAPPDATKRQFRHRLRSLLILVVICGCLASVGIIFSALSAQFTHPDSALPAPLCTGMRGRSRRDDNTPISGAIAASYSRYSTDLQDASSIGQQQRKCRDEAVRNGHDLRTEFEFFDEAVSGTKVDRAGFQAMLTAARAGRFKVLYFESLSRLARECVISLPILKELVHVLKIRVISTSEGIDSDQAGWEFMAMVRSWMHGEFLTVLRAVVLRGQENAVLEDYSVGDWCFGYSSEPIPGSEGSRRGRNPKPRMRVIILEDHAKWVRLIFFWFVEERRKVAWIAKELTRLGAPKDHRSTTTQWRHAYVIKVLGNRKYIGIWPWGLKTNVRNPLTGKIRQEDRPPEEAAKYERERPHLRLVEDDQYFKAQAMLDENEAKCAAVRQNTGKLRGSTKDLGNPRHLLQGVVRCGVCGSGFKVSGAHGRYLECGGYGTGQCQVRTRLRRDLAERMILNVIGDRILRDPIWQQSVLDAAQTAWSNRCATRPDETKEVEQSLSTVEQKISKLLDRIESGDTGHDVSDRLASRRREREELIRRRDSLRRSEQREPTPPTADWVAEQLRQLHLVLTGSTPAAGVALRNLIGTVVVSVGDSGERKRKHLRGTFTLNKAAVLNSQGLTGSLPDQDGSGETITLDFREPPPWAAIADRVKELYDAGVRFADISAQLQCHRSWPAKALAYWHNERGFVPPDGRTTRDRLPTDPAYLELVNRAKELWDRGLLMQDIAIALERCQDTITAAIRYWYESRNLAMPDGRNRRKELPRPSHTPSSDSQLS
jgi:site-specific DNA recombinase